MRPYLSDAYVAEFRRGSMKMFYKFHNDDIFKVTDFLKHNVKRCINVMPQQLRSEDRGINPKKKEGILQKLSSLMPINRRTFFENLSSNKLSVNFVHHEEE